MKNQKVAEKLFFLQVAQKCHDARVPCLRPARRGYAQAGESLNRRGDSRITPTTHSKKPAVA